MVTFTATVTGTNGVPPLTGTVTFKDGATILGTGTLSGSPTATATFSTTGLAPGSHTITAIYSGDSNFAGSTSGNFTQTVKANTTATLISSLNPACFGQSVTFTATVAVVAPGVGTPTGTVTFKDGATSLATNTLSSGQATFTTSTLSAASHSLTAVYNGDANFNTNTSAVVTQNVNAIPTATVSGGGTICQGNSMTIQAALTGTAPWTVVWSDGVIQTNIAVSPATRSVSPASNTTYTVTSVSGANCSGSSTGSATLTVNPAVSVTPLTDLDRALGATAIFSTTASGTGPFVYAWEKNGQVIAGQTNSSLVLTNLASTDGGVYRVVVSGGCGSASSIATLLVNSCFPSVDIMLVIDHSGSMAQNQKFVTAQQACSNFVQNLNFSTNADQAGLASFNSTATLDQELTNSLQALDQAIHSLPAPSGETSISLGVQTGQTELLSTRHNPQALPVLLLLTDGLPTGSDTDSNALYTATQAKNAGTLLFTVGVGSDVDPVLLAGMASSTNDYFFATNSSQINGLFAQIATLICRPPTNIFINGLSNLTVCAGSVASFAVTVTATSPNCSPYAYQWQKDGVSLPGQTNSSLVISNVSVADAGVYALQVASVCRTVTNSATLTVNTPVQIVSPPANIATCPGTSASFSVSATGTGLSYQWYKGGSALAGQTGSSLV